MKKNLINELKEIKYLFRYERGRVISEQEQFESDEEEFVNYDDINYDDEEEYKDRSIYDLDYGDDEEYYPELRIPHGTKEKERTITTPGTKPKTTPKIPYKPLPGPKTRPKARKGDLTFDKLDMPSYKTKFRHSDDNMELGEEMDLPVMLPGTKEKERTITTPGTKPKTTPKIPYKPLPGPKTRPKARKGDMPDWLTFDKLGINLR